MKENEFIIDMPIFIIRYNPRLTYLIKGSYFFIVELAVRIELRNWI